MKLTWLELFTSRCQDIPTSHVCFFYDNTGSELFTGESCEAHYSRMLVKYAAIRG